MSASTTVVFADLTGSTGVFEALGNVMATQVVTEATQFISQVCQSHRGRTVKTLGDGVLVLFPDGPAAVAAMVSLQRKHAARIQAQPERLRMHMQVGAACGEIVEVDGDCYGDAVNIASRLSDLSGPEEIWATDTVIEQISAPTRGVRFRSLGPIAIRGKQQARVVFRVIWQEEALSELMTAPAELSMLVRPQESRPGQIELAWLDMNLSFKSPDCPVQLGRADEADFTVSDQRVSRLHARIDWNNGNFVLSDLSSYGTWVRFAEDETELPLRRGECVLHGAGEIALGASFSDFTVPTVSFNISGPGRSGPPR
ncbi:MAG: adenylate/guanylate cyclase domain-containing protein [Burkholderiales bacterium]|nr:adenylate/guanylate cyclase domain-containing protein [Burkholderiales bacterium]